MAGNRPWAALLLLLLLVTLPGPVRAESAPEGDEQAVLAELFALNRALEKNTARIAELDRQMTAVQAEARELAGAQAELEAQRQQRLERLGRRLRFAHEHGSMSTAGMLLSAESLVDFLDRWALVRQLMLADVNLLAELRTLKADVAAREATVQATQASLASLLAESRAAVEQQRQQIAAKEKILQDLRDRRAAVEQELAALERTWEQKAQPVLTALGGALQTLDLEGFTPDSLRFTLFPLGATAQVSETSLNRLLRAQADLSGLALVIAREGVSLQGRFDGTRIQIDGRFAVAGKSLLRFVPEAIRIDQFRVPDEVTAEILASGNLDIDMAPVIGSLRLQEVRVEPPDLVIRAGF